MSVSLGAWLRRLYCFKSRSSERGEQLRRFESLTLDASARQ